MTVLFLAISGPKFMKFWDNVGNSSRFLTPFPDCLYQVSCRRYWLIHNCRWVAKSSKIGPQFWTTILCERGPKNCYSICYRVYLLPCGKAWLSSVGWTSSARPGNEEKCRIFGGRVKWRSYFRRSWTKVHVSGRCRGSP